MKIRQINAAQLDRELIQRWSDLQENNSELRSPLFRPELVIAMAEVQDRLEIGVLEDGGEVVGFLPYWRDEHNVGRPYAGCLTDFQGMVARQDAVWDAKEFVRRCGLNALQFNHLLASQSPFTNFHHLTSESPFMDLSAGFEAYRQERRKAKSDELKEALRKGRKVQRDIGPLKFVPMSDDEGVLDTLLKWKCEQLTRMKVYNHLREPWVRRLFSNLMRVRSEQFAGMLTAVYIGDELAAVSMGVRSQNVLHGWVTAYNGRFAKYSPGLLLTSQLAQECESLGITRIDMGKGPEPYKRSFRSGATLLAEAAVDLRLVQGVARRGIAQIKRQTRESSFGEQARTWLQRIRYARQQIFETRP